MRLNSLTPIEKIMVILTINLAWFGLIVFCALAYWYPWWLLGYVTGLLSIGISYTISWFFLNFLFHKRRSRISNTFLTFGKILINYILQIAFIFGIIGLNNFYNGYNFFAGGFTALAYGPIAFIPYLIGISVVMLALVFSSYYIMLVGWKKSFS